MERAPEVPGDQEPGLAAFLKDPALSGDATAEEIAFLHTVLGELAPKSLAI